MTWPEINPQPVAMSCCRVYGPIRSPFVSVPKIATNRSRVPRDRRLVRFPRMHPKSQFLAPPLSLGAVQPDRFAAPVGHAAKCSPVEVSPHFIEPGDGLDAAQLPFWVISIKDRRYADELTAYLDQYPAGYFAALTKARRPHVDEVESTSPSPIVDAVELAFWKAIAGSGKANLVESYLQKYPEGRIHNHREVPVERQ
jgi:hypothetical protein